MKKTLLLLVFIGVYQLAFAQLTINVTQTPSSTPQNDDIYIVGTFNDWEPADVNYQLTNNGEGSYQITFYPAVGGLKFKFTRGAWDSVEGNENGEFRPDREFNYTGKAATENLSILSWEDLDTGGGGGSSNRTAADNVLLLDNDFYIPQLNVNRQIWIYLPPDYDSSTKNYPVLYVHDAQNIFDAYTSFSGEWEIDETLNLMHLEGDYGCIVVGVENGGASRLDEYSPWYNAEYQTGGQGDEYIEFIVNDLKPYIDANYRTLSHRDYTGIMGSSMGGLISHYAGIAYQDVFGKVGAFSCAFWFSDQSYFQVGNTGDQSDMKIYYLVGALEGDNGFMVGDTEGMYNLMLANGFDEAELSLNVHADGQHSEWFWKREFGDAYQWLFGDLNLTSTNITSIQKLKIIPNPANNILRIENTHLNKDGRIIIYSMNGQEMLNTNLNSEISIDFLNTGIYLVKVLEGDRTIFADKLVVER